VDAGDFVSFGGGGGAGESSFVGAERAQGKQGRADKSYFIKL
jgi:hypothetical protein